MHINDLYAIADKNNISVYHFPLGSSIKSMSVPGAIGMDADHIETTAEEQTMLAHELGHCVTGSFYTGNSPHELKAQKEYRANKWAVQTLIPFTELSEAFQNDITDPWELAEYFNVSRDFINFTIKYYEDKIRGLTRCELSL